MRLPWHFLLGLITGCAGFLSASERVVFYLDWFPGAQFAGLYVAQDRGYFADAGLELTLVPFAFGQDAPAAINADPPVAALGSAEGYLFFQYRARGANVCAFTAVMRESPAGLISLEPRPLLSAHDFAGRTLGVHRFADQMVRWFATEAGLGPEDYTLRLMGDDLDALARGEIDAHQGYATEEFVEARQRFGARARFLSFHDLGLSSYAQMLYSTREQIRQHGSTLATFVHALRRGWSDALNHPEDAVASIIARLDATADPLAQQARLEALRDYVTPQGKVPPGALDPSRLRRLQEIMAKVGLVERVEDPAEYCLELP